MSFVPVMEMYYKYVIVPVMERCVICYFPYEIDVLHVVDRHLLYVIVSLTEMCYCVSDRDVLLCL